MSTWHAYGPGIHMTGTDVDAKFQHQGQTVLMSYHNYCGPLFEVCQKGELTDIAPDDSPEFTELWRQYEGWWKAKGQQLYGQERKEGMKTTDALAIIDHLYFNGKPHMTEALDKATTKLRQQIADPSNTTCPTCNAQPHQPCQTYHPSTGWTPATHKITHASRLIQAKKEAKQ